jgi:hypothetical protein
MPTQIHCDSMCKHCPEGICQKSDIIIKQDHVGYPEAYTYCVHFEKEIDATRAKA